MCNIDKIIKLYSLTSFAKQLKYNITLQHVPSKFKCKIDVELSDGLNNAFELETHVRIPQ